MIYLFLANGFEEVEALSPLDVLRRAGQEVCTVGVGSRTIVGSHGVPILCDTQLSELPDALPDSVILPGGMPGTKHLDENADVRRIVQDVFTQDGLVCAICAAPSVLGHIGLLRGKEATCFPGFETELDGARLSAEYVCRDGNVITARGAGVALDFGFAIAAALCGEETAEKLRRSMQCR